MSFKLLLDRRVGCNDSLSGKIATVKSSTVVAMCTIQKSSHGLNDSLGWPQFSTVGSPAAPGGEMFFRKCFWFTSKFQPLPGAILSRWSSWHPSCHQHQLRVVKSVGLRKVHPLCHLNPFVVQVSSPSP
ncbi:hypothetical protein E2C01_064993 [Portunus trituberculatus]|uniref:Uncharacterized protein n=1 Tax=Portunus trituberculatus TaxID=210409 RepID=A0A5B7HNF9_PORTR|nr:hypothetical protein [Portunus trituberculatus]